MPWSQNDSARTAVGGIAHHAGGMVDCFSKLTSRTFHSTESELMAAVATLKRCLPLKRTVEHVNARPQGATLFCMDNAACLTLCLATGFTERTACVQTQCLVLQDCNETEIDCQCINTKRNGADPFAKALSLDEMTAHSKQCASPSAPTTNRRTGSKPCSKQQRKLDHLFLLPGQTF